MFDKTFIAPTRTEHIPYVKTIVEKRAPTDDSVKILMELESAAEQKVLDNVLLKSNEVGVEATAVLTQMDSFSSMLKVKFILNGEKFYVEEEVDKGCYSNGQQVLEIVAKGLASKITRKILEHSLPKLGGILRG